MSVTGCPGSACRARRSRHSLQKPKLPLRGHCRSLHRRCIRRRRCPRSPHRRWAARYSGRFREQDHPSQRWFPLSCRASQCDLRPHHRRTADTPSLPRPPARKACFIRTDWLYLETFVLLTKKYI